MHDKNGKEIHVGDFVKHEIYIQNEARVVVSQVIRCLGETNTCNLYLGVPYQTLAIREEYATANRVEVV